MPALALKLLTPGEVAARPSHAVGKARPTGRSPRRIRPVWWGSPARWPRWRRLPRRSRLPDAAPDRPPCRRLSYSPSPAIFDGYVAASSYPNSLTALRNPRSGSPVVRVHGGAEEPDHRHGRLLRPRRERPRAAAPPSSVMNSRRLRSFDHLVGAP